MRKLRDDEVKFCKKNIESMKKELEHLKFLKKYEDLMIKEGCWWNYQEKLKTHKSLIEGVENDIKMNEDKIDILEKQIVEGVKVKDKPTGVI